MATNTANNAAVPAPARSGSGDRWYTLQLRHRPALRGDIGNLIKIQGLVVGGEGMQALLLMPDAPAPGTVKSLEIHSLSPEEWTDFLQRSDDPEVLLMPQKAFHRKLRYEISGFVQQKVWFADGFTCFYCGRGLPQVQLSIDHFFPLEMNGANDTSNYLTACRKCNKDKGAEDPRDYCKRLGKDFNRFVQYLAERKVV